MKKSIILLLLFTVSILNQVDAQEFLTPFNGFSKKKLTYITMNDGTEIIGNLNKMKYAKKGLIKLIEVKVDGEKKEIEIEDLDYMYIPQNAFDAIANFGEKMHDATRWDESEYESGRLKEGYALFEKIDIELKGEKRELILQLLNPYPGTRIKVYNDPQSQEKGGMRLSGISVIKSNASNYYISKDGAMAHRMRDKDYKKMFDDVFGDCRKTAKEYGAKKKWKQLEEVVISYNTECGPE